MGRLVGKTQDEMESRKLKFIKTLGSDECEGISYSKLGLGDIRNCLD